MGGEWRESERCKCIGHETGCSDWCIASPLSSDAIQLLTAHTDRHDSGTYSTQPPVLCWTGNGYRPKCVNDLHLLINVWVAGKLCDPSLTRAVPEHFEDEYHTHYKALYKFPLCYTLHITSLVQVKLISTYNVDWSISPDYCIILGCSVLIRRIYM